MKKLILAFLIWKYIEKIIDDSIFLSSWDPLPKSSIDFLLPWLFKNLPFIWYFYR